jgi:AraC-like DNA-binding protein
VGAVPGLILSLCRVLTPCRQLGTHGKATVEQDRDEIADIVSRAVRDELRRLRKANHLTVSDIASRMGLGARHVGRLERGETVASLPRFLDWCRAVGVDSPTVLTLALQRRGMHQADLPLLVDLRRLIAADGKKFRPMIKWARNRLIQNPRGLVEVHPSTVEDLAGLLNCDHRALREHLAGFIPERIGALDLGQCVGGRRVEVARGV